MSSKDQIELLQGTLDLIVLNAIVVCPYLVIMLAVCLAASVVPARRALAIQPTEALREA